MAERWNVQGFKVSCKLDSDSPSLGLNDVVNGNILRCTIFQSRGVAQPGSASALGAEGRKFESYCPDQPCSPQGNE